MQFGGHCIKQHGPLLGGCHGRVRGGSKRDGQRSKSTPAET
jgi:hypothetical protein